MSDALPAPQSAEVEKLEKSLGLFDVFSIATGSMFSSGLFLLPGLAASYTGNSVYLAYMAAGVLILPALFCMAELSTAMPKTGGTYFFLDRSLGPMMGTVGGLGSWVAVVFKSAFALVGMGAYLGLYFDVSITVTAVVLTLVFGAVNYFGAKETSLLQGILVTMLLVILGAFVVVGLIHVGPERVIRPDPAYGPYFSSGLMGFASTIGLVFVSYAGLTKVASVAGEVENPSRNIPLGMILSLATATLIYTFGTLILVTTLPPEALYESLTPVADAGQEFLGWAPFDLGVLLIVIAAVAAFASTGNAGIMSASRYPFAMAKDHLLPERFGQVGTFGTPSLAIIATTLAMVAIIVIFPVESVAKLASAFQLLLFGLVAVAVIIMREARLESYKPGFAVPLYPYTPIVGILIAFWLIVQMGVLPIAFTGLLTLACIFWYQFYTAGDLKRRGAIFHVHERLGRQRYEGIERELMTIVQERTEAENLTYEATIARAVMLDIGEGPVTSERLLQEMAERVQDRFEFAPDIIETAFGEPPHGYQKLSRGMSIAFRTAEDIDEPVLFVFRLAEGIKADIEGLPGCHTILFLLVPPEPVGLDLRLVGHLADITRTDRFQRRWKRADREAARHKLLMRDDHVLRILVDDLDPLRDGIGELIQSLPLPETCVIVMVERNGDLKIAPPKTMLQAGDTLTILGEPDALERLCSGEKEPV